MLYKKHKKILVVFGTRPEAIKMAPLVKYLQAQDDNILTEVCVTGQHREMLDSVLRLFKIHPEYDLNIMQKGQSLFDVTTLVLNGMSHILDISQPDIVLVHGDTTTSMAAALAAFYKQIPVAHVEAGLRTNNINSPWPEELNRQVTARLASLHFCPTLKAQENLYAENISSKSIVVTGNTVIDSLYWVVNELNESPSLAEKQYSIIRNAGYPLKSTEKSKIVLITGHRRENFEKFFSICKAIKRLCESFEDVDFIYPMHLNPNVRRPIYEIFSGSNLKNAYFIEPLDYLPFITLMQKAYIILTDSGGIQEEAPSLGKPVLVMRDTTERPEAVTSGTVRLVGTDENYIYETVSTLLTDVNAYNEMSCAVNPYGDGHACERIVYKLTQFLNYQS